MNLRIHRLLALLSAAVLILALGACEQPTSDPNLPGSQPAPDMAPGAEQPAEQPSIQGTQPGTQQPNTPQPGAGGGPTEQPATQPTTEPPATQPTTEPIGGGPASAPTEQNPAAGSDQMSVEDRLQKSHEKIQEGLQEMRDIAAQQAATGEQDAKRAAEELQGRAEQAEESIGSGIEKLKQEMTPGTHP